MKYRLICIILLIIIINSSNSSGYMFNSYDKIEFFEKEESLNYTIFTFCFGLIYNLNLTEYSPNFFEQYTFNCSNMLMVVWFVNRSFSIHYFKNGESQNLIRLFFDENSNNIFNYYGIVTNRFICALHIMHMEW